MVAQRTNTRSWIAGPAAVKRRPRQSRGWWERHLDGWQAGVAIVLAGLIAALLAAPRPVVPDAIPLPEVDRLEQRHTRQQIGALATEARAAGLSYDVRTIGEMIRRFGQAATDGNVGGSEQALSTLRDLAPEAADKSPNELAQLRAYQTEAFLAGLRTLEETGRATRDLVELGGRFLETARTSGWIDENNAVVLSEGDLVTLYTIRWSELCALTKHPAFGPSLNDWRAYYRILLQRPVRATATPDEQRLAYVGALERYDSDYPSALARGVLYYRLGAHRQAAEALRTHLERYPNGAWTLRAQNYLAAANSKLRTPEAK